MRTLILFIAWILLCNISNAQKYLKNEVGIGIGISEIFIANQPIKYHNNFFFIFTNIQKINIPNPFFYSGAGGHLITKSTSSPTLHYIRKLQNHLFFQLSYQYALMHGKYYDVVYGSAAGSDNTYKFNYHQFQFGYNYQLFKKRIVNPYFGLGFNVDVSKSIVYSQNQVEKYINGGLLPYLLLGISVNLFKQISLRYEASLKTDLDYFILRPVSRLSVNYQF